MTIPDDFDSVWICLQDVLILDENSQIVHSGDNIRDILCTLNTPLKGNFLDCFPEPEVRLSIEETLTAVHREHKAHSLKIPGIDTKLSAFPSGKEQKRVVVAVETALKAANHMRHQLQERVKEVECLYSISRELKGSQNLDEAINKSIQYLIAGFQYPDITSVRIELKPGKVYGDRNTDPETAPNTLKRPILLGNKEIGRIYVFYLEQADFLDEEHALLTEISIILGNRLERLKYVRKLEKRRKILLLKNEKLLELTKVCSAARKKLQGVLDAITDKLVVIGADYNIVLSNNDQIRVGGTCHKEIFSSDERCENCPSAVAFSESHPAVTELRRGEKYYFIRAYPILNDEGEVDRVVETVSDVTKQKQMEA
ncbi:MAG: hypothetical protein GXO70_08720, partial [Acidobacteria bacterium]|nr:hypothetical protein [Acidobacteriota bacterium]